MDVKLELAFLVKSSVTIRQLVLFSQPLLPSHAALGSAGPAGKSLDVSHIFLPAHSLAMLGIVTKTNNRRPKGLHCDPGHLAVSSLLEISWICWGHSLFGFAGTPTLHSQICHRKPHSR